MPPKVDQLKTKVGIFGYRSSVHVSMIKNAYICYVEKGSTEKKLEVECPNGTETIAVDLKNVQYVKMKDFTDRDNTTRYTLTVGEQLEPSPEEAELHYQRTVQHSLQFAERAERDQWDHGLRSILATVASSKNADGEGKKKRCLPVKKVTLIAPDDHSNTLVKIKVELDGEERIGIMEIKADQADADSCKQLTNDFVKQQDILPTESTSLYRYIRSVVQRATMEKETAAIVDEINLNRFERVAGTLGLDVKNQEDNATILATAIQQLDDIDKSITTRIGQHGCGATIVNTILKRNVEKMKVINDLAAKVALVDPHAAAIMPDKDKAA